MVDVCVRYAYALDDRDWAALSRCFDPDAVGDYAGVGELVGYQRIEDLCRRALQPLEATQHLLSNHLVEVSGDRARARCYFQAQHVRGGLFTVAGRYDDRLRRGPEGWRITHRRQTILWTAGDASVLGSL